MAKAAVESPCINICKMEDGLCIGCFRTLDEIACWANVDDDGKRLILAAVAQRRRSTGGTATDEAA
ncbi:MAG: DUF1289 domain-containing protein [Sterolibacteriaceae bacterium]|nr:DUF1289 domain-containing protein [Sterolibacteriaceae bacterium]MBN8475128.1 DUF1289 domain-containing protein [Sulfuritalea sp.]